MLEKSPTILALKLCLLELKDDDIMCNSWYWNYTTYEPGDVDVAWASPPCTEYSKATNAGIITLGYDNKIVLRTLCMIA